MHSRGLKFGIYEDYGNFTCAGYPGILGSLELDAFTFAEWNVDFVKLDGCYSLPKDMDAGYSEFGFHLNKTGRPMVYSCSWPVYQTYAGLQVSKLLCEQYRKKKKITLGYRYSDRVNSFESLLKRKI